MSLLDAHIPQLVASQSAFGVKAGVMRSTIGHAEQEAVSALAFHAGESAAASPSFPRPVRAGKMGCHGVRSVV